MKVSQKLAILILKTLYLSKQYCARRLLNELPDKGQKLGSIDSLMKRIRKTGTTVRLPGSIQRVAAEDLVPSQEDKPKRHGSAHEISQMLQMMSWSAVVWRQSHLSSHSLTHSLLRLTS